MGRPSSRSGERGLPAVRATLVSPLLRGRDGVLAQRRSAAACENDEGPGEYRLHDLGRQRGLVGVRLLALEFVLNGPTLDSHFDFADGQRLSFRHFLDDDLTRVL